MNTIQTAKEIRNPHRSEDFLLNLGSAGSTVRAGDSWETPLTSVEKSPPTRLENQ